MRFLRGTGRTVTQLRMTPKGADYVVINASHISYCRILAVAKGINLSDDINIISSSMFTEKRYRGRSSPIVMIDHAVTENIMDRVSIQKYRSVIDIILSRQGTVITV